MPNKKEEPKKVEISEMELISKEKYDIAIAEKEVEVSKLKLSLQDKEGDAEFNPSKNPKAISIVQQEDGNYKGYAFKFGKIITVREVKPEDALVMLITHNGE